VRVAFYAQELNAQNRTLVGQPIRLQDAYLSSIPGYAPDSGAANWANATTTFDTTGWDNKYVVFLVYVWLIDANNNMVPEMAGHGLSSDPKALQITKITDIPVEAYSNNVGFYSLNDPLHIVPAPTGVGGAPAAPENGPVTVDGVSFAAKKILLNTRNKVTVNLTAGDTAASAVYLAYYDGNPSDASNAFAFQNITYIDPNSNYMTSRSLTPSSCGEHTIYAVASTTGSNVSSTKSARVRVTVDPVSSVQDMEQLLAAAAIPKGLKKRLGLLLAVSEALFQNGKTKRGLLALRFFNLAVQRAQGLPGDLATSLTSLAQQILGCVGSRRDENGPDTSFSEAALHVLIHESGVSQQQ
jgi:hypothetical protein